MTWPSFNRALAEASINELTHIPNCIRDLAAEDARRMTFFAIGLGNSSIMRVLLGFHPAIHPNGHYLGLDFMAWAVFCHSNSCVAYLLRKGADPAILDLAPGLPGFGYLGLATRVGNFKAAQLLLSAGADPLMPSANGLTMTFSMCMAPHPAGLELWRSLVQYHADTATDLITDSNTFTDGQLEAETSLERLLINSHMPWNEEYVNVLFEEGFEFPTHLELKGKQVPIFHYINSGTLIQRFFDYWRVKLSAEDFQALVQGDTDHPGHPFQRFADDENINARLGPVTYLLQAGLGTPNEPEIRDQIFLRALTRSSATIKQLKVLLHKGCFSLSDAPASMDLDSPRRSILYRGWSIRGSEMAHELIKFGFKPYPQDLHCDKEFKDWYQRPQSLRHLALRGLLVSGPQPGQGLDNFFVEHQLMGIKTHLLDC